MSQNRHDDDPFADDPEAEFAPTQAMSAIPFAADAPGNAGLPAPEHAPQAQQPPRPGMPQGPGGAPQHAGPRPHQGPPRGPQPIPEKRFGVSAILALVGGVLTIVSFFLPMVSITYLIEEYAGSDSARYLNNIPRGEFNERDRAEFERFSEEFAEVVGTEPMLAALGFDSFVKDLGKAKSGEEIVEAFRGYTISSFRTMEVLRLLDTDGEDVDKEGRAGGRLFWLTLAWIPLSALIAILLAAVRGLRPLNGLQVGWSGFFGLLWTASAACLFVFNKTSPVLELNLFQPLGAAVFLVGGLLLWSSAFAGTTGKNWWKGLLVGAAMIFVFGGSVLVPALVLTS